MADERVRLEIGFEGGQVMGVMVPSEEAERLERHLASGGDGTVELDGRGRQLHRRSLARPLREALRPREPGRLRLALALPVGLEVGIVGLPNAGKTTLFNALTRAGAEITAYATVSAKANVGMAPIADERLERVAAVEGSRKVTPAADPGRGRARHGRRAARQPSPGRRAARGPRRLLSAEPIRSAISRRSASSCSSPTASTSSVGWSGSAQAGEVAAIRR